MQTFIIGRDSDNQIVLNDNLVSRHHAQLTILDNGMVMIKDLDSSNGTFVNGNRITEAYLNSGDIVKCGTAFLNWTQYINMAAPPVQHFSNPDKVDITVVAAKAQDINNLFLSFIMPFLKTIDNGSFFRRVFGWIYLTIAIINILIPFYALFKAIDSGIFKAEGKYVLIFLVLWLVLALLCWFGFQLWWNRRDKVIISSYSGAEFVATPVLAHFIQTLGEWYGVILGVLGFMIGFLALLLSGSNYSYSDTPFDVFFSLPFLYGRGWQMIFMGPITGFFIVFLFRFLSEWLKAFAVIANNTKNNGHT